MQIAALCLFTLIVTVFVVTHIGMQSLGFLINSGFIVMPVLLAGLTIVFREGERDCLRHKIIHLFKAQRLRLALFIMLLLVPYASAFGSWVQLDLISRYYLISLLGLLALILPWLKQPVLNRVAVIFCVYLVGMSLWHYIQYPFGIGPLYRQTVEYKGIKYEPGMAQYLKHMERVLRENNFRKEQGIIAPLAPGLVYLMGSYHPGGVLWSDNYVDDYLANLTKAKLKEKPVLISQSVGLQQKVLTRLNQLLDLDFEKDYKLVEQFTSCVGVTGIYFPRNNKSEPYAR